METYGKHYVADLWDINSKLLNNLKDTKLNMIKAVKAANGTVLNVFGHKFSPQGVSVVITISESHLSIHTFPEHNFCSVDIYTCGKTKPENAIKFLLNHFKPKKSNILELERGLPEKIKIKKQKM